MGKRIEVKGVRRRKSGEGRRGSLEAMSSQERLAPSPGAFCSNGIVRRSPTAESSPRMNKCEQKRRLRGSRNPPSPRTAMRNIGIDIGAEHHVVAAVDDDDTIILRPVR